MSKSRILADFCKSGTMHHLSRRFHSLNCQQKQQVIADIQNGIDANKAIRKAKRAK